MEDLKKSEQECSICFNNIIKGVKTDCKHLFHDKCINAWLKINNTCPLCRNCNPTINLETNQKSNVYKPSGFVNIEKAREFFLNYKKIPYKKDSITTTFMGYLLQE